MKIRRQAMAFILAAAMAGTALTAYAASSEPVTDGKVAAIQTIDDARISMTQALAAAEKTHQAKALRATLRETRDYGLVWDVRLDKKTDAESRSRIRTFVDAKTGKVLASDVMGIGHRARDGYGRHCDEGGRGRYAMHGDYAGRHCR